MREIPYFVSYMIYFDLPQDLNLWRYFLGILQNVSPPPVRSATDSYVIVVGIYFHVYIHFNTLRSTTLSWAHILAVYFLVG